MIPQISKCAVFLGCLALVAVLVAADAPTEEITPQLPPHNADPLHEHQCKHNDDQMLSDLYHHGMDRHNYKNVHQSFASTASKASQSGRSFDSTAIGFSNIRIVLRTIDVDNNAKVCSSVGQTISDMQGGTLTCTADDILTPAKRQILENQVLPQAIALLNERFKVDPVVGNLKVGSTSVCYLHTIPQSDTTTGVANADYVLYVSAAPTSGSTIAWAGYCELDASNNRPIVGRANFSPRYLINSTATALTQVVRVGTHEMMHGLGFSYSYVSNYKPSIIRNVTRRGKSVFAINGSATLVAGQNFFGCSSLDGLELEDEGGSGTQYSHWERRNQYEDVIAGIVNNFMYISNITMAYFHDLGIYQADFSYAEVPVWGRSQGCALTTTTCVDASNPGLGWMFCNDATQSSNKCSYDNTGYATCYTATASNLPSYFQYFPSQPTLGGNPNLVDYCPMVLLGTVCSTTSSSNDQTPFGLHYGTGTRC
ncbi:major surface protease, GP63, putative, partial [Bodo saltans]